MYTQVHLRLHVASTVAALVLASDASDQKKKEQAGRPMRYMSRIVTRSKNNVLEVYLTANLTAKICYTYQIATCSKFTATLIYSVICHTKN